MSVTIPNTIDDVTSARPDEISAFLTSARSIVPKIQTLLATPERWFRVRGTRFAWVSADVLR